MSIPLLLLDEDDSFDYRLYESALGDRAHVHLNGVDVSSDNPDQLEDVAEQFFKAARDLRLARMRHTCDQCSTYQPGFPMVAKSVETNGVENTVSLCRFCCDADELDSVVGW